MFVSIHSPQTNELNTKKTINNGNNNINNDNNGTNDKSIINKILVFDMDETLGHFVELSMFLDAVQDFYKKKVDDIHFFKIFDLFPEFIRPNIIKMLKYINHKRNRKYCNKIVIYTNNQGQKSWAELIAAYFEYRVKLNKVRISNANISNANISNANISNANANISVINKNLFDTIIGAYKIGGKQIEPERTTHDKTVSDLIKCLKINENTKICFLDDQYHPLMEHKNVYYINCKPYIYNLSFEEMAERYFKSFSQMVQIEKSEFVNHIKTFMNSFRFTIVQKKAEDYITDKYVSREMFRHIRRFLSKPIKNKGLRTKRKKTKSFKNIKNKTLKIKKH
jgi:hypothetical protein